MTETTRISQQELESLPRWARLAFAARCLRRARQLVGAGQPARILDGALGALEQAARTAQASDELADAAASAYTLALDNLDARGAPPGPSDDQGVVVGCMVAHA